MAFFAGIPIGRKNKQLVRFAQTLQFAGERSARAKIVIVLGLNEENRDGCFPHRSDHPVSENERPPGHRTAGEIDSGAQAQFLIRVRFDGEHGLNPAVGAAGDGDFVWIDVRSLFKVSEGRQLVFEMSLMQCDGSRCALGSEGFDVRVIRRTALTASMRDEENVTFARKELAELGFPTGFRFAPVVIEDCREWAISLRPVDETVEYQLAAGKRDFLRPRALPERILDSRVECGKPENGARHKC